jgi:hypothetical protein
MELSNPCASSWWTIQYNVPGLSLQPCLPRSSITPKTNSSLASGTVKNAKPNQAWSTIPGRIVPVEPFSESVIAIRRFIKTAAEALQPALAGSRRSA